MILHNVSHAHTNSPQYYDNLCQLIVLRSKNSECIWLVFLRRHFLVLFYWIHMFWRTDKSISDLKAIIFFPHIWCFRFWSRNHGYTTSGLVVQYLHWSHSIVETRKCRFSRWYFVSISLGSWDKDISGLEAAIFEFRFPVMCRLL